MHWVFLSPHFDDVVLSCGGMVWELIQTGQPVQVWTVCAGAPEPGEPLSPFAQHLHARWGTGVEAVAVRRAEDETALVSLKVGTRYWDLPDCIYRRLPGLTEDGQPAWLVDGEDGLWQPVHPQEQGVVERLAAWIVSCVHELGDPNALRLVSPLTLGNHVDHSLVRAAAEAAAAQVGCEVWYYPDYPYAVRSGVSTAGKVGSDWQQVCQNVALDGLAAWQEAVACYVTQLSTFWADRNELNAALEDYWRAGGGTCLWQPGTGVV